MFYAAIANHSSKGKDEKIAENLPSSDKPKAILKTGISIANHENPRTKNIISYFEKISSKEAQPARQPKNPKMKVTPPCSSEARARTLPPTKPSKNAAKKGKDKRLSPRIQKITNFFLEETQHKMKASQ